MAGEFDKREQEHKQRVKKLKARTSKIRLAISTFKSPKPKFNKRGGRILNPDSVDDRSFGEIRADEEVKASKSTRLAVVKKKEKGKDQDEENDHNRNNYDGQASAETGGDY
jgi:hypothetical protein